MKVSTVALLFFLVVLMTPAAESVKDPIIRQEGIQLAKTVSRICSQRLFKLLKTPEKLGLFKALSKKLLCTLFLPQAVCDSYILYN